MVRSIGEGAVDVVVSQTPLMILSERGQTGLVYRTFGDCTVLLGGGDVFFFFNAL